MAGVGPLSPLTDGNTNQDFLDRINVLTTKVLKLEEELTKTREGKKRPVTEWNACSELSKFGGDPKEWKDWEFKFHNLIRPLPLFEMWLNHCKDRDEPLNLTDMAHIQQRAGQNGHPGVDYAWYDEQL